MTSLKNSIAVITPNLLTDILYLEKQGKYDSAVSLLENIWPNKAELPSAEGLPEAAKAELYLRCGSILGFYGLTRRIANSQEMSKDLITRALDIYNGLGNEEKIAECENYISLGYWRTGEFNEAETWIASALSRELPNVSGVRLYTYVLKGLILLGKRDFESVGNDFKALETDFLNSGDDFLIGNFFNNYGLALKNLGSLNNALGLLSLARTHFSLAGHLIYTALAENNISQIFRQLGNYDEAHSAIDRASKSFADAGDETRSGFSLDTKALIYIEQCKFAEAADTAEKGISILRKSENAAYLSETMLTKAKALLFDGKTAEALLTLSEGIEIARVQISEDIAKKQINEFLVSFDQLMSPAKNAEPIESTEELIDMQLELPKEISSFNDYSGVLIRNDNLASYGLKKGTVAIVADTPPYRGCIAAVRELATGEVYCGKFDTEFDVVCIENIGMPPYIFNSNEVEVIGRIVGYCSPENGDPKTAVTAIKH